MRVSWIIPPKKRPFHLIPYLAWHPQFSLASVWIRAYQMAPYLRQLGYTINPPNTIRPFPDIAVFLRRYSQEDVALARQLKKQGTKIVVDVVANYFQIREQENQKVGRATSQMVGHFKQLVDIADQVWTVSPFLQKLAAAHHPSAHFISDSVDPRHFFPRATQPNTSSTLTFGWSGVAAKAAPLASLEPLLKPYIISQKVQLLIIADKQPTLNLPFTFSRWRYGRFPHDIAKCDLCIAPRQVDNNYDRGHSLFKIGVFMAMGVPAFAAPVPSYNLLLADQKAGTICDSQAAWNTHIANFIENPQLRQSYAQNAAHKMEPFLTPGIAKIIDNKLQILINQS